MRDDVVRGNNNIDGRFPIARSDTNRVTPVRYIHYKRIIRKSKNDGIRLSIVIIYIYTHTERVRISGEN